MQPKKIMLAALLAGLMLPALAESGQPPPQAPQPPQPGQPPQPPAAPAPPRLQALDRLIVSSPMGRKVVRNAPYSAEAVTERMQTLADGNQIVTRQSTLSYRDSAGRTRQDVQDDKGEVRTITITDPVDGATFILNPRQKTGTKVPAPRELAPLAADAARARVEQLRAEGKLPAAREGRDGVKPAAKEALKDGGQEFIVKRVERTNADTRVQVQENIRIQINNNQGVNGNTMQMRVAPVIAGALGDSRWSAKPSNKDLGSKEIDGVKANGKLRSYEIPAGEVGNRNPIVVTDESWYSPELQITVYTRHSDPRSGDRIYRLAGLKREEPAASLFTVPPDYSIKDVMLSVRKAVEEKK